GKLVSDILGVDSSDKDKLAEAMANATPDQLLALKKADQEYALQMQSLGFKNTADLAAIAASDTASARAREIAVKDNTPKILSYIVTIGFFAVLAFLFLNGVPAEGHDLVIALLGSLGTAWTLII